MSPNNLLASLDELGHVGEIARLLSIFGSRPQVRLTQEELFHLADATSGITHRYPRPSDAVTVCIQIGLVGKRGGRYVLTKIGRELSRGFKSPAVDFSVDQAKVLLGILLDDEHFRTAATRLLRFFSSVPNRLRGSIPSSITSDVEIVSRILQQLRCLRGDGQSLYVDEQMTGVLGDLIVASSALSEDELWKRLQEQSLRARQIEELVTALERKRLLDAGRRNLAEAVQRVSKNNSGAGYDISSFELNGEPRFVEVKSSVGKAIRFFWSSNEREFAGNNSNYWIYFVPFAQRANEISCTIVRFRDPLSLIASGELIERPSTWLVSESGECKSFVTEHLKLG